MVTMAQSGWPPNDPDSLQDVCLDFCARHLFVLADMNSFDVKLRPGISLPRVLCEGLIRAYSRCGKHLSDEFLKLFDDPTRTQLRYIQLADYTVTEEGLKLLCKHPIVELDVSDSCAWTANSVKTLSKLGKTLSVLKLGSVVVDKALNGIEEFEIRGYNSKAGEQEFEASPDMRFSSAFTTPVLGEGDMCSSAPDDCFERMRIYGRDYIFDCPNLRVLSLKNCNFGDHGHDLLATVLSPLERLTHLDLTKCQNVQLEYLNCFKNCHNLLSLVLADIDITELWFVVKDIAKIKSLRHLDLSQSFEVATMYPDAEGCVKHLATHLPALISLDLSGTNLAGFMDEPEVEHRLQAKTEEIRIAESAPKCPIPGLEGKQLEFLGLLGCPHNACQRKNIPAAKVTGDDSEDQVLLSVEVYQDRTELLTKAFNNLFHLFRTSVVRQQYRAVEGILIGMKKHKADKHVQISGSASLFYIVKGEEKDHINYKLKRRIIEALLDGMSRHIYEQTMMRNGCLTLCHFSIPQEVLFCYDRLVRVLLRMLKQDLEEQDQFVTRIGIYLLNCLACQVDGREKQLVGDLGAIGTMLSIIRRKLTLAQCDEIMEVAWSTMWNVTDETAMNCQRFMEEDGMQLFLQCLRVFPNKAELLRNMMGLMGNVAEVAYLRPSLMKADYINVFSELLDSESDGIEVSYNAAGVLAHMCSDGEGAWPADLPPRPSVLARLTQAIQRWDISSSRNINYRSFEPILRLACSFETPESQHWAVWALCNLTKVYPEKYCELLEKEKGLDVLHKIINHRNPYKVIKELARTVIHTHRKTMQKSAKGNNSDQAEGTQEEETDEQCMSDLDEAADEELHQDV